jgi:NADP-dependent 3-hydroxy acid dehydrogenase YdfG
VTQIKEPLVTRKTAIVVGVASEIGKAIAHTMAQRTANTILIDNDLSKIENLCNEIR